MDLKAIKLDDLVFGVNPAAAGFGPSETQPDFGAQFDGKIFKPYNKRDKLTKLVEFSTTQAVSVMAANQQGQNTTKQAASNQKSQQKEAQGTNQLVEAAEDMGFTSVEDKSKSKQDKKRGQASQQTQAQKNKAKIQAAEDRHHLQHIAGQGPQQTKKKQQWAHKVAAANASSHQSQQANLQWQRRGMREPSYEVKTEWEIVEDFTKQRFDKLPGLIPGKLGCKVSAGKLPAHDSKWDKVSIKHGKKLPAFEGTVPNEMTYHDPIIQELANEGEISIFGTDLAVAALMTSSKAQYPWDLVIKKAEGFLFIDKRDKQNEHEEGNMLDFQTVNETAAIEFQPLDEDGVNGVRQLMKEAVRISNKHQYHSQSGKVKQLEREDPFVEDENQVICSQGYYYNIFNLGKDTKICIRSSVHSYIEGTDELMNTYVLPEWNDKRQNWTKNLDTQTTLCLTTEITDNTAKFCRWAVMSMLAGVEKMNFAFVQRADSQANTHKVVGSFTRETHHFANQLNLNIDNCWAVLKDVLDTLHLREEKNCDFLYLKDLNQQPTYKLFKMVEDEAEDDDEDNNSDE